MRRILAGLFSIVTALALSLTFGSAARAADDILDGRCTDTSTSLGRICVEVIFDNTNCEPHSLYNCNGLNGAQVARIGIYSEAGNIATDDLLVSVDTYGDGVSDYVAGYWVDFYQQEASNVVAAWPIGIKNANRICVRVRSQTANRDSGVNIGGMNPYGLSRAGACPTL